MDLVGLVNDGVRWYSDMQSTHPFWGSVAVGWVVFPFADYCAQRIEIKQGSREKIDWKKIRYTAKLAPIYGAGIYGLIESGNMVGTAIDAHPALAHALGPDGKAIAQGQLGPNLFGNIQNFFFFYNNGIGKRTEYNAGYGDITKEYASILKGEGTAWQNLKANVSENVPWKEYRNAMIGSFGAWGAVQYANYKWIPQALRPILSLGFVVPWVVLMTYWSNRRSKLPREGNRS